MDVAVTEPFQRGASPLGQRGNQLGRLHVADEFPQDGGLVAAPGADLKHPLIGLWFDRFRHLCHDVRLGDGLLPANRQRPVVMGRVPLRHGDEFVARHSFQGAQHAVVRDPPFGSLLTHHAIPPLPKVTGLLRVACRWRLDGSRLPARFRDGDRTLPNSASDPHRDQHTPTTATTPAPSSHSRGKLFITRALSLAHAAQVPSCATNAAPL